MRLLHLSLVGLALVVLGVVLLPYGNGFLK